MINLNGPTILFYAAGTQASGPQQSLIEEWFSPSFHDWEVFVYGAMLLSLAMLTVFNRRIRARDVALVLVTTALSLQSARHIELFIAASTPVFIDQLALATPRMRAAIRRLRQAPAPARRADPGATAAALPPHRVTLLMAGLGGVYVAWLVPKMQLQPYSLAYAQEFPVCAAQWLAEAPEPLKIFNQYGEGGYLAYALSSHGDKVFIFGDAALMGDQMLETYAASRRSRRTGTRSSDVRHRHRPLRHQHATRRRDGPRHGLDQGVPGWSERRVRADGQALDAAAATRAHWAPGSVCARQAKASANAGAQSAVKRTDLLVIAGAAERERPSDGTPHRMDRRLRRSWCSCSPSSPSATPTCGGISPSGA